MKSNTKKQQGFSLVELLIVVLTIAIIAVIAIPNLLAARRSSNEGSTISALRTLHGAQITYQTSIGQGNYAGTVSSNGDIAGLATLQQAGLIDSVLASGTKSGYNVTGAVALSGIGSPATFFFSANPISSSGFTQTGTKRFCITQQGYIGVDAANLGTPFTDSTALTATPIN